uniref:Uncharacterized protein n=1 Tax=Peronospora matthiolae TaxID=2874970 RepID=A0AAV1VEH3_9STRA
MEWVTCERCGNGSLVEPGGRSRQRRREAKKEIRSHAAVGSGLSGLQVKLQAYAGGSLDFRRTCRPTRGISGLQTNLQAYAGDLWTSDELAGLRGGISGLQTNLQAYAGGSLDFRRTCRPTRGDVVAAGASSRVDEGAGELDSTQPLSEIDISQGRYEELKPAQPTGTQGEHKVIQQGTDRSTPSVSRQAWASGRSTLIQAIL